MTVEQRFVLRNAGSAGLLANAAPKGLRALFVVCRPTAAAFALLAVGLFLAAVPALAQMEELTVSNAAPLEGPGAGVDTVLVNVSGLAGNATATVTVTTADDWITIASNALTIMNGPNRLRFQYAANTGGTRTSSIVLVPQDGSLGITITVSQAGAGFAPAGPVTIITSITGPQGIDVDSQGNLYILEVTGSNLYEWAAATQHVNGLVGTGRPNNTFVDVALDAAGDIFALENTPDGMLGSQVEQIRATQGQTLPPNNIVFFSDANDFLFPAGLCVDSAGTNLNVTTVDVSDKCLIDQFGSVYELDSVDANENVGSFASPPTNADYQSPPTGQTFFPNGTYVDPCGNQLSGVSGSLYGLAKDGSGFIYFVDQDGSRLNRYDPAAPWYTCTPPNGVILPPSLDLNFGTFTTVANLVFPPFYIAADTVGNIYLSEEAFSQIQEIPRAYVSPAGPFNEPVGGGTDSIYVLPQTQTLTGVFAPVSSDTTWLNVTSAANGVVTFSFTPNPGPPRIATINVLGVPIQVVQAESQVPATMAIVSGNNQTTGVGGLPFATNLLVKVTNQAGDALANVPVQFVSPSQQLSITTDQRGYASAMSFNATAVGPVNVTASIPGTAISQTFTLTGVQTGISIVSGSNQQVEAGVGLFGNMSVLVAGPYGQPLPGVPVTFTAPASGASGTFTTFSPGNPTTTITVNTNANGIAQTSPNYLFYANSGAGSFGVTASISGIAGASSSTCVFNLTNFGPYQELVGNQSAFVNNAYASPLSLKVLDGNGNPIANVPINFVVGASESTLPGAIFPDGTQSANVLTGADGIATAPPMTANSLVGSFAADALIYFPNGGGTLTAGWTLTNLPSAILEGAVQNGLTSRTLTQPMIVKASANATAGTMVFTVVPGSGGASGSFNGQNSVTVNLDPQGYGTSPLLTANSSPGTFTVTANDGTTTVQSTITTTTCLNPNNPTWVVTSGQDYNPQNPNNVIPGTLRYALTNACGGSTIDLTQLSGVITLGSRLRIDDNLTIIGPGPSNLAIDGGHSTRLFFIGNSAVAMSGLTLQNGLAQGGLSVFGGGGAGMGGAIFMEGGELTLSNMTLVGNEAVGGGSGTATLCTTNCDYGGGGFAGDAQSPEQGGSSGDLFGVAGPSNGASGGIGGGGAGTGDLQSSTAPNGGNGGFAAGGGTARYILGTLTQSGNGGFGGGGAGGADGSIPKGVSAVLPGSGGYGAGDGHETLTCAIPTPTCPAGYPYIGEGGSGAGFGGAIFEYAGQLTLNGVQFLNNSAFGGTLAGLSGQSAGFGQGKGGALFIYNGAILINNSSTFGTSGLGQANFADAAGLPGNGNSAAPYTNGATCPGQDTVDICGNFGNPFPVTITVPSGSSFFINGVSYTGTQTLNLPQGQYTLAAPAPQATGVGTQIALASWSDGGAPSHTITVGPGGLSITGTFATQYLLTISAGLGGLAAPASSGYYNAGSVVNLNAVPTVGSVFTNWTGPVATASSAATTVTMDAPETVTANFTGSQMVIVNVPQGVSFTLNGANYTGPQFVSLAPGQYMLSTTSPQMSAFGDQEVVFNSWSDAGAISHTITLGTTSLTITGAFTSEYELIASAGAGGTISPVNGFYSSGTVVNLTATPNPGYVFHNWTGAVATSSSATTTVALSQAQTVTANFWPAPSACVAPPANVAAWWKGDGSANDETLSFNATLGGDVSFAPGLVGQAFSFDGTQSPFVSVPAGAFPPQPGSGAFSFETWFQTSGGNGGVILGQQPYVPYTPAPVTYSPAIYVGIDGNLYVEMFYNGGTNPSMGPAPVNDNQWHHVAVTYDGSTEIGYLDGASFGQSPSYTQVPIGSPLSYQLGTGNAQSWPATYPVTNNNWYTFNGLIDEPTVYSRALTAAEVLGIAQAGSYGKCDPVAMLGPVTLNFAGVVPGQTATQTAVLSNPGNAPLAITAIAADAGDANFSVLSGNAGDCAVGTPVQSNASCNIRVQFSPQSAGPLAGSITVQDNSLNNAGVQTVQLTGAALDPQTITFGSIATQTVGTPLTLTATATSGLAVGFSSITPTVCTVAGNTATFLTYGSCTVTAAESGNGTYSAANPVSQTFAVISPQTITFPGIGSQMLNTQLTLTATASSGLPVAYASSTTSVCSISGNSVAFVATGKCTIKASQSGNANYLPAAPVTQSFNVAKEAQSITWATIPTQTVQQTVALTASASSGLPIAYTSSSMSVCTVSGSTASMVGGGTCTIKASQAGNGTYAAQSVSQSFTVNKLAQSITFAAVATPQSIGAQASLSASSTSGLTVAISPSPATVCTVSGATVTFIAAGTCKLTATQPGNSVYAAATAVSQSIVVDKIAQTISFGSIGTQNAGSNLALTAAASSGLAVTYTASPSSVCTVSGATASFVGGGTCTITAAQPGNATYLAAPSAPQSFVVTKVSQTISFPSIPNQNVNASVTLAATATSGLTVSYNAAPSTVCAVSGSTATMVGSGTCTITASQAGNSIYTAATAVPQSFLVSKIMQSITFGSIGTQTVGASLTLTATASSGLAVSYSAAPSNVCKVSGSTATMIASGTCTITASQAGNSTYAAAPAVPVSFEITKVAQTITFGAIPTQTVGTPLTLTAYASSGLTVTYIASPSNVCKVSGSTVTMSAAGTCNITASQSGNAEYAAAPNVLESF